MHACGHDGHMAMTLALGEYVNSRAGLNHNVLLIFQPPRRPWAAPRKYAEQEYWKSIM